MTEPSETASEPSPNSRTRMLVCFLLIAAYVLSVAIKLFSFNWNFVGPTIFADELLYRLFAQSIHEIKPYTTVLFSGAHYPPVYPALLSLSFFFEGANFQWYRAMLGLNCLASSSLIFVVYYLARFILGRWSAFCAALVCAAIPFNFIYPPMLLSENLSMPLFILTFAMALRPQPAGKYFAAGFGLAIVFSYLCKYLFLVYAPMVVGAFVLSQWMVLGEAAPRDKIKSITSSLFIALLAFVVVFAAWLSYSSLPGGDLYKSTGLFLSPLETGLHQLEGLGAYASLIFFSLVLGLCLPLPLLLFYMTKLCKTPRKYQSTFKIYAGCFCLQLIILLVFVSIFCWSNAYQMVAVKANKDILDFQLTWRYMMYLLPLAIPLAFAGITEMLNNKNHSNIIIVVIISCIYLPLMILGYLVVFEKLIWPFGSGVVNIPNATDLAFFSNGLASIIIIAVATCVLSLVMVLLTTSRKINMSPAYWNKIRLGGLFGAACFFIAVYTFMGIEMRSRYFKHNWGAPALVSNVARSILAHGDGLSLKTAVLVDNHFTQGQGDLSRPYPLSLDHTAWLLHFWLGKRLNVGLGRVSRYDPALGRIWLHPWDLSGQRQYGLLNPGQKKPRIEPGAVFVVVGVNAETFKVSRP